MRNFQPLKERKCKQQHLNKTCVTQNFSGTQSPKKKALGKPFPWEEGGSQKKYSWKQQPPTHLPNKKRSAKATLQARKFLVQTRHEDDLPVVFSAVLSDSHCNVFCTNQRRGRAAMVQQVFMLWFGPGENVTQKPSAEKARNVADRCLGPVGTKTKNSTDVF